MRCLPVLYLLVTMFIITECANEYCVFYGSAKDDANCGTPFTKHILHYIPPISEFVDVLRISSQPIKQLPYNAFHNLSSQRNVSDIGLSHCKIKHVDADAFLNLGNLKKLNLGWNDIHHLDIRTFQHVKQLRVLTMAGNKIEILPKGLFENLVFLEVVALVHNRISQVDNEAFKNTPSLQEVYLQYNKLQFLNASVMDNWLNVTHLYLNDNPWVCDCNLLKFYQLYRSLPVSYHTKYPDIYNQANKDTPTCESPSGNKGKKWDEVGGDDECNLRVIMPTNDTTVVFTGANVTLSCVVQSYTKPDIKWRKNSGALRSVPEHDSSIGYKHTRNVTLYNVQTNDAGIYFCTAENDQLVEESHVNLLVSEPTTIKPVARTTVQVPTTTKPVTTAAEQATTATEQATSTHVKDTGELYLIPKWMLWTLLAFGLMSTAVTIAGVVFGVHFIIRKCNRNRHASLPITKSASRGRGHITGRSNSMCVIFRPNQLSANSDEESDEEDKKQGRLSTVQIIDSQDQLSEQTILMKT